jgi:PTS system mannose-specific IIA component
MIGAIIIAHGNLAQELLRTANTIVGTQENIIALSFSTSEGLDDLKGKIEEAIRKVGSPEGILILTDMFGGSPTNVSIILAQEYPIEILTGVNLPMVLELALYREFGDLKEVAQKVADAGKKSIFNAYEFFLLRWKKNQVERQK